MLGALSRGNYRLRPRPNLGVVVVSTGLLSVRSDWSSPGQNHRVGNIGSPSLLPHQRSDRHRTSGTSAASPPEPFSCVGIAALGKYPAWGGIRRHQPHSDASQTCFPRLQCLSIRSGGSKCRLWTKSNAAIQ